MTCPAPTRRDTSMTTALHSAPVPWGTPRPQAAALAAGLLSADLSAVAHDQGVVLVEQVRIRRQMLGEKGAVDRVEPLLRRQAQPMEDPPGVGVDHEGLLAGCVQQDVCIVSTFGTADGELRSDN